MAARHLELEYPAQEFLTMVVAGLAGTTPHMMSATVLALSRLIYQYHCMFCASWQHLYLCACLFLYECQ
jgi:ribosomal RNA-processing protein 12